MHQSSNQPTSLFHTTISTACTSLQINPLPSVIPQHAPVFKSTHFPLSYHNFHSMHQSSNQPTSLCHTTACASLQINPLPLSYHNFHSMHQSSNQPTSLCHTTACASLQINPLPSVIPQHAPVFESTHCPLAALQTTAAYTVQTKALLVTTGCVLLTWSRSAQRGSGLSGIACCPARSTAHSKGDIVTTNTQSIHSQLRGHTVHIVNSFLTEGTHSPNTQSIHSQLRGHTVTTSKYSDNAFSNEKK